MLIAYNTRNGQELRDLNEKSLESNTTLWNGIRLKLLELEIKGHKSGNG